MPAVGDEFRELYRTGLAVLSQHGQDGIEAYKQFMVRRYCFVYQHHSTAQNAANSRLDYSNAFKDYLENDADVLFAAQRWPNFSTKQQLDTLRKIVEKFFKVFDVSILIKVGYDPLLEDSYKAREKFNSEKETIEIVLNPSYHRGQKRETFKQNLFALLHEATHVFIDSYNVTNGRKTHREIPEEFDLALIAMAQPKLDSLTQLIKFKFTLNEHDFEKTQNLLYSLDPLELHANLIASRCTADLPPIFDQPCNTRFLPTNPANISPKPQPALTM